MTIDLKTRLEVLETKIEHKNSEIKALNDKVNIIQENNKILKVEFTEALEKVVKEVTESLINIFTKKQDDLEKRSSASLDSLHAQIQLISNHLLPSSHCQQPQKESLSPSKQATNPSQKSQKFQCEECGKSFGSNRALANHMGNDHQPKK